ncbi:MAG TPA: glycosyltransferase family 2 protein [Candidatus Acidoferrales bacterium]
MENILVTAVIPTRNRPELVQRAIASVRAQTYRPIDIVVVIDGPDEATRAALAAIADDRLRVVALDKSVGGSDARNIGAQNVRGEWIAFLDDDDEWLPGKIEKQLALAARTNETYPVISGQLIAKSPYGEFIWPRRFPADAEPISEYLFNRKTFFRGEGQLQTSMLLTRKSLMELVPFTSGLRKHQDFDWYLRVFQTPGARFHFVPEPLVNLYLEEDRESITTRPDWRFSLDWLKANRERMTKRAYAGFISTQLAPEASLQGAWSAAPRLFWEMFRHGKPDHMDVSMFAAMWLMRPSFRRTLRAWRHPHAEKQTA